MPVPPPLASRRGWTPILSGKLRSEAEAAVSRVADALLQRSSGSAVEGTLQYGSLQSGVAGEALLFAYLYLHTSEPRYRRTAEARLSQAAEWIAAVPLRPQLYEGFVGVAWVAGHIAECLQTAAGPDVAEGIDEAVWQYLGQPSRRPMQFDLLRGLAGLAVYALERLPRPKAAACLERIVEHLYALGERDRDGTAWRTYPEMLKMDDVRYPSGNFNLGVAHGSPAIVSVLGQVCAAGIAQPGAYVLLEEAVRWLLARRHPSRAPSRFPSFYYPGIPSDHARLAWCHGDPGVAAALAVAARSVRRADWAQEALDAARSGEHVARSELGPFDATLCHGAMGLAHIYNRLFHQSDEEWLRDAARAWVRYALALRREPHLGIARFSSWRPLGDKPPIAWGWRAEPGFLTGATGTALALLAAASSVEPSWDRVLAISSVVAPSGMVRVDGAP